MRQPPGWRQARTLALDTSAFIYHLEASPTYTALLLPIFQDIERGRWRAVASTLAFLEAFVEPSQRANEGRRAALAALLASFPGIAWIAVDLAVADRAASLRTRYRLRTPDAIHLATAVQEGADLFLTNDHELLRVREVPILLVDELR